MKEILKNPYLSLAVRLVIGGIFIFWSIGKINDPSKFVEEIMNYRMLPEFIVNIFALVLPWVELISGFLLVLGVRVKAGSAVISGLLIMFIIAIITAMARNLNIGCGCFTESAQKVGWPKLGEDLLMLTGALYIFFFPAKRFTIENVAIKEAKTDKI